MSPERTDLVIMGDDPQLFRQFILHLKLPHLIGCEDYEDGFDGSFGRFPRYTRKWLETEVPPECCPIITDVFCSWTIFDRSDAEYFRGRVSNENIYSDDSVRNRVELLSTLGGRDPEANKVTLYLRQPEPGVDVFVISTTNWSFWRDLLQEVFTCLSIVGAKRAKDNTTKAEGEI